MKLDRNESEQWTSTLGDKDILKDREKYMFMQNKERTLNSIDNALLLKLVENRNFLVLYLWICVPVPKSCTRPQDTPVVVYVSWGAGGEDWKL
jgi:hypothetical protein